MLFEPLVAAADHLESLREKGNLNKSNHEMDKGEHYQGITNRDV